MRAHMRTKGLGAGRAGRMLALMALLLPAAAQAQYQYRIEFNFTITITAYEGDSAMVAVPETIGGLRVTSLGSNSFASLTNLMAVTVPAGVTNVGNGAFASNANLQAVYFRGNAPVAGVNVFTSSLPIVYYQTNTTGWGTTYAGRPTLAYSPPVMAVTPTNREVGHAAGTTTFTIENTGGGFFTYEATESSEWLEVTNGGGSTLTVAYSNNAGSTARTGTVTDTASGVEGSPQTVTIVQSVRPVLTRQPASTNVSCLAIGGRQVVVGGNQAWTAVSSTNWLVITSGASGNGAGLITFRVAENSGAARTGYITITGGGITHRCFVNQAENGPAMELNPVSRTHAYGAASGQVVAVAANVAWTAVSSTNWLVITSGESGSGNGTVTYRLAENGEVSRTATITVSGGGVVRTFTVVQMARPVSVGYDFDGDGKADLAVYHRPTKTMFVSGSTNGSMSRGWTQPGLLPAPGDYDGDGLADWAMYHPESGQWQIQESASGRTQQVAFGWYASLPLPGDYDGDGLTDQCVYDPQESRWYFRASRAGRYSAQWGEVETVPVPADYDGDGATDLAVYEPYSGEWSILKSSTGRQVLHGWGWAEGIPVPADYDGDGRTDIAVFHRADCAWYISLTSGGSRLVRYPLRGTIPVPADYDGDGKADLAVYHPASGYWFVLQSTTRRIVSQWWGAPTAHPIHLYSTIHAWFDLP